MADEHTGTLMQSLRIISPVARGCYSSFRTLCSKSDRKPQAAESVKDVLNLTTEEINIVKELSDRFEQWVGNLGALQAPDSHLSLDYRLKEAKDLRETVFGILNTMLKVLSNVVAIADGSRPNRSRAQASTISALLDQTNDAEEESDYDISSSDSDSSIISESTSSRSNQGDSKTELQELLATVRSELNTLFRVAIFIRKSSGNKMRDRAAKTDPFDNRADIMYIRDRFNHIRKDSLDFMRLAERLGEANARRRQYFKYRRDHNDRLAHIPAIDLPLDQPVLENDELEPRDTCYDLEGTTQISQPPPTARTVPTVLAETEVTGLVDATVQLLPEIREEDTMSVVSFATSIGDFSDDEDAFPQIPEEGIRGDPFLCPYCCTVQKLNSEKWKSELDWRKHVLRDLRPYVCTFSSCGFETYQSQQTWFEHELLNHRCQWICELCSAKLDTAPSFQEHISVCYLKPGNGSRLSSARISAITERSRRPVEYIDPNECPFCPDASWVLPDPQFNPDSETLVVTTKQFQKHLGKHLQKLALFSLPRSLDEQPNSCVTASGGILQSQDLEGIDTESLAWGKLDRGRGWAIVAKKKALFTTLSVFLGKYQKLLEDHGGNHASGNGSVSPQNHKVRPLDGENRRQSSDTGGQDLGSPRINMGLSFGHDGTSQGPFLRALGVASYSLGLFDLVIRRLQDIDKLIGPAGKTSASGWTMDSQVFPARASELNRKAEEGFRKQSAIYKAMIKDLLLSPIAKTNGMTLDDELFLKGLVSIDEWAKQFPDEVLNCLEANSKPERGEALIGTLLNVSEVLSKVVPEPKLEMREVYDIVSTMGYRLKPLLSSLESLLSSKSPDVSDIRNGEISKLYEELVVTMDFFQSVYFPFR